MQADAIDRELSEALIADATTAAEVAGGGLALLFALAGESLLDIRLRAAAGFPSAEAARETAKRKLPDVREALVREATTSLTPDPEIGERAAGGLVVHPLREGARVAGALLVGAPAPLDGARSDALRELAGRLALRLDHARLALECAALSAEIETHQKEEEDKSEEVLRLSEALFAQDIELLRNNEKLGKVERLKNDFIEKMSRELRTPLNSIIESIISVLAGEDDALSDVAKAALRSALDDGTAFLRTLQNILDLWKIKQGELPLEVQDVNFRELVDEAIFSIQDAIGDKPLRVRPQLSETFPRIRTDLAKVNQILFLLLDNAAKFTPAGEIEIAAHVEDETLHCFVRDSGVGICPDDQQLIFDEFFQVDDPSSQKYRGAGLGLTLVRDLVALLEGEISVQSDVGRGAEFRFQIPVQLA